MDMNPESVASAQLAIQLGKAIDATSPAPRISKEVAMKSRLAIVETIYHQAPGESPTSLPPLRSSWWLQSDEQPYLRELTVGEEWTKLDTGWIGEQVGLLVIRNKEGLFTQVKPTEQERREAEAKIIEIGYQQPDPGEQRNMFSPPKHSIVIPIAEIDPGRDIRLTPCISLIPGLRIRCRTGKAKLSLGVFPR